MVKSIIPPTEHLIALIINKSLLELKNLLKIVSKLQKNVEIIIRIDPMLCENEIPSKLPLVARRMVPIKIKLTPINSFFSKFSLKKITNIFLCFGIDETISYVLEMMFMC